MKKLPLVLLSFIALTTGAFAHTAKHAQKVAQTPAPQLDSRVYFGAQGGISYDGLANKHFDNIIELKKDTDVNMGARVFMGYNFTKNFGLEGGFLVTDDREIKVLAFDKHLIHEFEVRQDILDLTPRVNVVVDNFNFYARAGVAYIDAFNDGQDNNSLNLTYGLGVDYKLTDHVSTGIAWSHYNGGSNKPIDIIYRKYQPNLDFYGISLTYHIA